MVVCSQMLYAAAVWVATDINTTKYMANMVIYQKTKCLRAIRAYRTVSNDASLLLADNYPTDLLAIERHCIHKRYTLVVPSNVTLVSRAMVRSIERKTTIK